MGHHTPSNAPCGQGCLLCRPNEPCHCGAAAGEPCKNNGWAQLGPIHPARFGGLQANFVAGAVPEVKIGDSWKVSGSRYRVSGHAHQGLFPMSGPAPCRGLTWMSEAVILTGTKV